MALPACSLVYDLGDFTSATKIVFVGPDAATVSFPAAMTFGLPETGVARKPTPRSSATARTAADASTETVEASPIAFGARTGSLRNATSAARQKGLIAKQGSK